MKRRCLPLLLGLLLAVLFCGCAGKSDPQPETGEASMGSSVYRIRTVRELASESFLDTQFVGELVTPGTYTVQINDITRVAYTDYRVLTLLKGDPALEGQTIRVAEVYSHWGDTTTVPICSELGTSRAIVCGFRDVEDDGILLVHRANQIIPIAADGAVQFDSAWPDSDEYQTLDDFRALFDDSDRTAPSAVQAAPATPAATELSSAELAEFEQWLNDPANNGFLLSNYHFIADADLDAVLSVTAGLPRGEADETQRAAYEAVTGTDAQSLQMLPARDLALYLQVKTGCDASVFSNFTWLYMAAYDAWFAPEQAPGYLPVRCTGGRMLDDEYYIDYEPTGEVPASFTSGTITLYPFEDGWRVLANSYLWS